MEGANFIDIFDLIVIEEKEMFFQIEYLSVVDIDEPINSHFVLGSYY